MATPGPIPINTDGSVSQQDDGSVVLGDADAGSLPCCCGCDCTSLWTPPSWRMTLYAPPGDAALSCAHCNGAGEEQAESTVGTPATIDVCLLPHPTLAKVYVATVPGSVALRVWYYAFGATCARAPDFVTSGTYTVFLDFDSPGASGSTPSVLLRITDTLGLGSPVTLNYFKGYVPLADVPSDWCANGFAVDGIVFTSPDGDDRCFPYDAVGGVDEAFTLGGGAALLKPCCPSDMVDDI